MAEKSSAPTPTMITDMGSEEASTRAATVSALSAGREGRVGGGGGCVTSVTWDWWVEETDSLRSHDIVMKLLNEILNYCSKF